MGDEYADPAPGNEELVSAECPECGAPEGKVCIPTCPDYGMEDIP
jgi:hypothetical protein